jgi:hypothetical protein
MAKITDTAFHNGENRLANFLKTNTFEIRDKGFGNLINLVFETLEKKDF